MLLLRRPGGPSLRCVGLLSLSPRCVHIRACCHACGASTLPLPDPRTPVSVPAGSTHACVRACWIHARPCPCLLDPRTYALAGYARTHARTRPMHACTHRARAHCSHWAYACMHAPGPCTLLTLGLCMHACTGPMHAARTGPMHACMHRARARCSHWVPTPARSRGPCTLARTGSPCPLRLHACTHQVWVPMPTRSRGPCTHARTGSPCPLARGVPTHARTGSCVHARAGPGTHACTGPMRACSLRVPMPDGSPCMHALGLCTLDCRVPMHMCQIPALVHAASHVVLCSSYM